MADDLQNLCEQGQDALVRMDYLAAERLLARAAKLARGLNDFDTLSRVYMPLQETRRQRRLRCGEGVVCLDLISSGPDDKLDGRHIVENFSHGQLLVAGWGTCAPALSVRKLAAEHGLFVETFLAAVFPVTGGTADATALALLPTADSILPPPATRTRQELLAALPAGSLVLDADQLLKGLQRGNSQTFALVDALWERLHLPALRLTDALPISIKKIDAYERIIEVDDACEKAHQNLSKTAAALSRQFAGRATIAPP